MAHGPTASRTLQETQKRMSRDDLTDLGSRSLYQNTNSLVCAIPPTAQDLFDLDDSDSASIAIDVENDALILRFDGQ